MKKNLKYLPEANASPACFQNDPEINPAYRYSKPFNVKAISLGDMAVYLAAQMPGIYRSLLKP